MCYPAEFVVLGQTVWALLRRSNWKKWPLASRLSRSLKVIGTDTARSATCDFLLQFHSNNVPFSYRFRGKRRFQSKITNPPHVFDAHDEEVPLGIGYRRSRSKNESDVATGSRKNFDIFSRQPSGFNARMWQTDRRTSAKTVLRIASRGNNIVLCFIMLTRDKMIRSYI